MRCRCLSESFERGTFPKCLTRFKINNIISKKDRERKATREHVRIHPVTVAPSILWEVSRRTVDSSRIFARCLRRIFILASLDLNIINWSCKRGGRVGDDCRKKNNARREGGEYLTSSVTDSSWHCEVSKRALASSSCEWRLAACRRASASCADNVSSSVSCLLHKN